MSANSAGSAATHDRLQALMAPVIRAAGYDLEELILTPMGRRSQLRVVVDRDEGITLDDVAGLSRALADVLDEDEGVIGKSPYVLEVTSPGVDRPLTEPRHWRRAVGRLVQVNLRGVSTPDGSGPEELSLVRARITGFDGTAVTLHGDSGEQVVPLDELGPGKVQLEFNRPADSAGDKRERPQRHHKQGRGAAAPPDALSAAHKTTTSAGAVSSAEDT